MSLRTIVAVDVATRPFAAPSISWICTTTKWLSVNLKRNVAKYNKENMSMLFSFK